MADGDNSVLDKAESFARRVLERLGSKMDSKLGSENKETLSPREVGELTSRIERVIEASLREDADGVKRVAPNRYKILFTYEETSRLNTGYIEALAVELRATIFEYINNRRYETLAPIQVETGRDLFAKLTVIKPGFEGDDEEAQLKGAAEVLQKPVDPKSENRTIRLKASDGRSFTFELRPEGAPAYIGRAAGNAVRIDDPSISRMHCSIALRTSGDIVISDLGSSNGTSTNGKPLASHEARPLNLDDAVLVGDVKLTVAEIS